jgi:protein-tyrosine phosphatase
MAAAVLHNRARDRGIDVEVSSSGTADYHVGEGPNELSLKVWSDAGYTYHHVAQQFSPEMFDNYDLILVMDKSNLGNVLRLARNESSKAKVRMLRSYDQTVDDNDLDAATVPDPWGYPREHFEEVLVMIEQAVDGLLDQLAQ